MVIVCLMGSVRVFYTTHSGALCMVFAYSASITIILHVIIIIILNSAINVFNACQDRVKLVSQLSLHSKILKMAANIFLLWYS